MIVYGTEIVSPFLIGVRTGRQRPCVACSKLYPSTRSLPSLNHRPKDEKAIREIDPME